MNGIRESDAEISRKMDAYLRTYRTDIQKLLNDAHTERKQLNDESAALISDRLATQLDAQRGRVIEILDQYRLEMRAELDTYVDLMVTRDDEIWAYLARIHRRTPMDGVRTAAGWVRELQGRWLGSLG